MPIRSRSHLSLAVLLVSLAGISAANAQYSGGSGILEDPYQIATAADLIALGETPDDYDKHFILTADIDLDPNLPGRRVFDKAVIGGWGSYFSGVFDGNGHRVMNMTISGIRDLGLFGRLREGAEIRDLGLEDVNVVGATGWVQDGIVRHFVESRRVGGLAGYNSGSLIRCYSTGAVKGEEFVGGLVGMNWRPITDCYSTASVHGSETCIGGLVGINEDVIRRCYSAGAVSGSALVGGFVGITGGSEGSTGGTVASCFWDTQTSGQSSSSGGTGKTTDEMRMASTFLAWGTCGNGGTWTIDDGRGYPRLSWENSPGEPIDVGATLSGLLRGAGTEDDPYQVHTAEDLHWVGLFPGEWNRHFVLTGDIDLDPNLPGGKVFDGAVIAPNASPSGWGFLGTPFAGVFDGKGHAISRLVIVGEDYLGLFGRLASKARVKDIKVVDSVISGLGDCIGGLAGASSGSITTCYSAGVVSGDGNVGGLVGACYGGSITASDSSGPVHGRRRVGGLAGYSSGIVSYCHSASLVRGMVDLVDAPEPVECECVGGLVGENIHVVIHCHSSGTVSGDCDVGGLVGLNRDYGYVGASFSNCDVRGNRCVGGLVGKNSSSIVAGYSTGTVEGDDSGVGGFVGYNDRGYIAASYSHSQVTGNEQVGGFTGFNVSGDTMSSYSTGEVSGATGVGGFVGDEDPNDPGTFTGNFWDVETSGQTSSAGGLGLSTAEMQEMATFLGQGWDFVDESLNGTCDYWLVAEGNYPALRFQADSHFVMPEGLGTAEEPYVIRDTQDLGAVWFEPTAHYRLEASVDVSGVVWSMAAVPWFCGVFDGNRYTIRNLRVQGGGCLGLFGRLDYPAVVSALGLEAVDVNGTGTYVGGLAGFARCHITECYTSGTVRGRGYVGGLTGLAGFAGDRITASYSAGSVSGDFSVGGLAGINGGDVAHCYSACAVSGDESIGGLIGRQVHGISQSYSSGLVTGNENVGGLVGRRVYSPSRGGHVTACFWDVETSGQSTSVGGTGLATSEMQTPRTFLDAGWNFIHERDRGTDGILWILEDQDYPRLWWERVQEDPPQ